MNPTLAADDSFCIAVLGDFLGNGAGESLSSDERWEPRRATPETVLELLGLEPALCLSLPGNPEQVRISFESLADFGADSVFGRSDLFRPFREAREAIRDGRLPPETYLTRDSPPAESSVGEVRPEGGSEACCEAEEGDDKAALDGPGLLDAILDNATGPPAHGPAGPEEDLIGFVHEIVRPHIVPADSRAPEAIADLDMRCSELMGTVLHSPEFMELEAAWRSMVFLLSRADSSGKTRVFILPVSRSDLFQDLHSPQDVRGSRLFRALSDPRLGAPGRRWGVAIGAYGFGSHPEDIPMLSRVAEVASSADVPFISGMDPRMLGLGSFQEMSEESRWTIPSPEEWGAIRDSASARWISLVAPRFLLRGRYGREGQPCKSFHFEEPVSSRADLLWGNGAFLCAALLSEAYSRAGWAFHPSDSPELGGMPLTPMEGGDDPRPSPLEVDLSLGAADRLAQMGFVPMVSFPQLARIRVGGLRSISTGGEPLHGRWRR